MVVTKKKYPQTHDTKNSGNVAEKNKQTYPWIAIIEDVNISQMNTWVLVSPINQSTNSQPSPRRDVPGNHQAWVNIWWAGHIKYY